MWASTRDTFRAGDPGWPEYVAFIGLPHLTEVRTLDAALNVPVEGAGPFEVATAAEVHAEVTVWALYACEGPRR